LSNTASYAPRPPGTRRGVRALAIGVVTVGIGFALAAPSPADAATRVRASQPLVAVMQDHVARTGPSAGARRIETVQSLRPLTRVRTILPVLRRKASSAGKPWLLVRLPGRPNGHAGWISAGKTRQTSTPWHIVVGIGARKVTVYRDGRVTRRFKAVVGTPSTPTPPGRFFVEEALNIAGHPGGPYALATSARSNVLQEFGGGPGQIGLHGTDGLWGPPGIAASHGCIRINTGAITWVVRRIGSGVPLTIKR
jgi:lipoprotein-anchoring transpeptidase ErfK/SrfK